MKVTVLFARLGPYHHARLRAAAAYCELTAIELSAVDKTYAWDQVAGDVDFQRVTLFHDADIEEKSLAEVRRELWQSLDRISPQVVSIPGWGSREALLALIWCCNKGVPAVVSCASACHGLSLQPDGNRVFISR